MIGYVDQPKTVYSNSLEKIWNTFAGSTQVSLKAFLVGSVWECEFEGIIEVTRNVDPLSFITDNNFLMEITESGTLTNTTQVYGGYLPTTQTLTQGTTYYNNFRLKGTIIRLDTTTIRVMFSGDVQESKNATGSTIPTNYYQDRPAQKISTSLSVKGSQDIPIVGDINQLDVQFYFQGAYDQASVQQYPIVQNGTYKIYNITNLPTGTLTTNDHLALTNLNAGADQDGGHTQLVALNGRTGGQVIIGGKLTGDNLELKSNSATPLVNHILLGSALDTKFHRIFSSNPATPLVIEHDSILDAIKFKISGNDKLDIRDGEIRLYDPLFLGTNAISEVNEITSADLQNLILRTFNGGNAIIIEDSGNIILNRNLNANTFTLDNVGNINLRTISAVDKEIKNNDTLGNLVIDNLSSGELQLKHSGITHIAISGNPETFFRNAPVVFESSASQALFEFNSLSSNIDNSSNFFRSDVDFSVQSPIVSLGSSTALGLLLSGPLATDDVEVHRPTNFLNNNIRNVATINGIQPSGGLSAGLSNSAILTASTAEQSILPLTFVGSRQVPPNTFKAGDSYHAVLSGNFSSQNGDTLTIRLKGGTTGTTILATVVIPLNASTGVFFEVEIDFSVRAIGSTTVADLATNFDFTYNQNVGGSFQGERLVTVNNTTFDTTILNQLEITAQFSSANANNSIETVLSNLTKTY
jgi:hypothetical protein